MCTGSWRAIAAAMRLVLRHCYIGIAQDWRRKMRSWKKGTEIKHMQQELDASQLELAQLQASRKI